MKIKKPKSKFHWTHLIAVGLLALYFIISKINLAHALSSQNTFIAFLQIYFFGIIFACLFLYIFSHDKFFPVAKEIEKEEEKKEKKYLAKYLHHGKVLATFLIGVIGGPVFSSLTARLLINNHWYKYLIIIIANIPSTIATLSFGQGIYQLMLK
ncbi:MAG: hypothetical protein WA152_02875 [Microgenomates group bacterium]